MIKRISYILLIFIVLSCNQSEKTLNILDFGAVNDAKSINTSSIQEAIDKAHKIGGATVIIPKGIFLTGTLFLKENVTLRLEQGAILLGSTNINDYTPLTKGHNKDRQPYHLIVADNVENITIEGKGTIDGNGESFWQDYEKDKKGNMIIPRWIMAKEKKISPLIEITKCKNVTIKDVTIKTGGGWNVHLHNSMLVRVDGINIINNLYSPNSDGIDITGSTDVMISNCYIKTCDDAICLKTTPESNECRRITVTNCIIETLCVGLKLGCGESFKDMSDVTFSNCIINKSSRAIGLYIKEGSTYENISITNIVSNTNAPLIFNRPIQIQVDRNTILKKPGTIRNVTISNFICTTEGRILLTADKDAIVENIILRDITINYPMIEDPTPYTDGSGSSQFPKKEKHFDAINAKAAIVAENIKNLVIDNLIINWPKDNNIPIEWKHPERIENGNMRIHKEDYSKAKQTEFSVLWGKNLTGGYIYAPLSEASSSKMNKYILINSTLKTF